ncbi:MAG: hybrid sensor histidine kinase/response regulator [Candidatus Riflebacteria bacterium]|nr:hybrid sensor histidine kinase/response regulator [Candidatus Riflebacteria bacterium]
MEKDFNILVADDEHTFCEILKDLLSIEKKYNVILASNREEVIKKIVNFNIDVIILDKRFPTDLEGMETFKKIKELKPELEIIMLTAYPDPESNQKAYSIGVSAYLIKTDDYGKLIETINKLCEKIQLRRQNSLFMKELKKENLKLEKIRDTLKDWNENLINRLKEFEIGFKKNLEISRVSDPPIFPTKFLALCMNSEISGFIKLQRSFMDENKNADNEFWNKVFAKFSQVNDYIFDISKVYCDLILAKPFEKKIFDLTETLQKTLSIAHFFAYSKNLILEVENFTLPPFFGNPQLLSRAVLNLFKLISELECDADPEKIVKFRAFSEGGNLKIEMIRSSSCFLNNMLISKFESKTFCEENENEIYLLIIKQVIEFHNGQIELSSSDEGRNFKFVISLPQ